MFSRSWLRVFFASTCEGARARGRREIERQAVVERGKKEEHRSAPGVTGVAVRSEYGVCMRQWRVHAGRHMRGAEALILESAVLL